GRRAHPSPRRRDDAGDARPDRRRGGARRRRLRRERRVAVERRAGGRPGGGGPPGVGRRGRRALARLGRDPPRRRPAPGARTRRDQARPRPVTRPSWQDLPALCHCGHRRATVRCRPMTRTLPSATRAVTRTIAVLTYDGAQSLDVTGPIEVFATASRLVREAHPRAVAPYAVEILAARPGPIRMSSGIRVVADRAFATVRRGIDTLLVSGGDVQAAATDVALRRWLRAIARRVRRLASVCSGAFVLAEAGLLD